MVTDGIIELALSTRRTTQWSRLSDLVSDEQWACIRDPQDTCPCSRLLRRQRGTSWQMCCWRWLTLSHHWQVSTQRLNSTLLKTGSRSKQQNNWISNHVNITFALTCRVACYKKNHKIKKLLIVMDIDPGTCVFLSFHLVVLLLLFCYCFLLPIGE